MVGQKIFQNNKGFTLAEVLIAITILAIGMGIILSGKTSISRRLALTKEQATMSMLLDSKFQEILAAYEGQEFDKLEKEKSGDFQTTGEKKFDSYKWTLKLKELEFPNFLDFLNEEKDEKEEKKEDEKNDQENIQKMISTILGDFLKDSVRELEVTVESKGKKLTTSTYLVTFKKEIKVPI